MTILKNFGFNVFRLREAKDADEYLLFDLERKTYNQYNEKRLINTLSDELFLKGIDFKEIAVKELSYDERYKPLDLLREWVSKEKKLIDNLGYQPTDGILFEDEGKFFFNVYCKSKILNKTEFINYDWESIKSLLMNLVGNQEQEFDYFINWIAWQIQNPMKRLPTSIILQGEHGTGKSKFCELVLKNIFARNFCEIGQADINKEYNEFILGKQMIVANEVIHNDNKFLVPDKLKNFVTDEYLSINRKFKDTIYVRNFAQWIFVTNNDMPLKIEKGDRRYSVFKSKKLKNGNLLITNLLKNLHTELEGFLYHLTNLELDFDYVATPLMNAAKEDLIKLSLNSVEEFLDNVKELGGLDVYAREVKIPFSCIESSAGTCVITQNFYEIYGKYCFDNGIKHLFTRRNFTMQLKKAGFLSEVVRIDEVTKRVIIINGVQ